MERVLSAVEEGRCAVAISGNLVRDPDVLNAMASRASLTPMALSGNAVGALVPVSEKGLSRAIHSPGGMVVLVEPETGDRSGMSAIANLLSRAPHQPEVLVVSRNFNPFSFSALLPGVKVGHVKSKGKAFLKTLPEPKAAAPAVDTGLLAPKKKKGKDNAPRLEFVGREELLNELTEFLGQGGPIVVSGPRGIGRNWLIEHATAATSLQRSPDLELGYGVGFDTLIARIAELCRQAGNASLVEHLQDGARTPISMIKTAIETIQSTDGLSSHVMVIRNLDFALGQNADLFQKSRLEMLLEALLTNAYPLRLVFVSRKQPVFYREAAAQDLRRLEVTGIQGKTYYEIFQAYNAPEFARDKIGPLVEKLHGHPLAIRSYAVALRKAENPDKLLEDPKFLKLESAENIGPLNKHLARRVEKLAKPAREALATLAHIRGPAAGSIFADLGVNRSHRMALLSDGLIDMFGTSENRRYRVHPAVRSQLSYREVADFDTYAKLSEIYFSLANSSEGIEKLSLLQEGNRCAMEGRKARSIQDTGFPDSDSLLESCYGMVRSKKPRFDLAAKRLEEILKADPSNSDAHLLKIEMLNRSEAKPAEVEAACEAATNQAPVPEIFHQHVNFLLARRAKGKAIKVLENAVELLPSESRLHTRLASMLLRQGRRPDAITHLERAMELEPMLPDAYGLLGMARRAEGCDSLDKAESLFREAVRLAPNDPVQLSRLVYLLLEKARGTVNAEEREAMYNESKELLEPIMKAEGKSPEAYLLMAQLTRESSEGIDRAKWLLKQARLNTPRGHERHRRIRIESALLDIREGKLDEAENALRSLGQKDPSNANVFAAIAQVLEARGQFIPAHAELLRSRERVSPNSLQFAWFERELARLQAIIEAQAAGLMAQTLPEAPSAPAAPKVNPEGHQRIIRRRKTDEVEANADEAIVEPSEEVTETTVAAAAEE